jgi:hypothetical protein
MSLAIIANELASKGRGPDTMLVHMAPEEVRSLQALAKAHGGSLTINPETGLPEAGFLKSLLPALIGFGLNLVAPGVGSAIGSMIGASGAVGTGLLVGGLVLMVVLVLAAVWKGWGLNRQQLIELLHRLRVRLV